MSWSLLEGVMSIELGPEDVSLIREVSSCTDLNGFGTSPHYSMHVFIVLYLFYRGI